MGKLNERRKNILQILEKSQLATVTELSEELKVTTETIRKDLLVLEKEGSIVRIHGGAALSSQETESVPYSIRKSINSQGKRKVAVKALELIHSGDIILLENSTTTAALCQELIKEEELVSTLTIVTNSFYIAQCLKWGESCLRLLFLGGWVSASESSTRGNVTADMMKTIHTNKAFLSGAALNKKMELTAFYERDMQFQQTAMENTDETVLLLDSGKYPKSGVMKVSDLSDVRYMVTDIVFSQEQKQLLEEKEVQLVQA